MSMLLVGWSALAFGGVRPELSGPERSVDLDRFRIHWTEEGVDAPSLQDEDRNGRPDLVDAFALALPDARRAYEAEGWRALIDDDGDGGSAAIDIYVHQIDSYGYTHAVDTPAGASCFIELDPALSTVGSVARSVATHELHHCVEFRYNTHLAGWIYEAAATYEQYTLVVDPALAYPLGVLYEQRLDSPERKLGGFDGRFEYSGFLWMKYWSERDGVDASGSGFHPERLPELWSVLAGAGSWDQGLNRAGKAAFGTPLPTTFLQFAEWNGFACSDDDGGHYLPDVLPCIADTRVPTQAWDGTPVDLVQDDFPYTAAYLDLAATDARVGVTCDGVDGLRVGLVPLDSDGVGGPPAEGKGGDLVQVDGEGGPIRVVVASTRVAMDATCRTVHVAQASLVSGGKGCDQSGGLGGMGATVAALIASAKRRRRSWSGAR